MTPILKELHWLALIFCTQLEVLVFTYKALCSLGPVYLTDCLMLQVFARPLLLAEASFIHVPPLLEAQLVGARDAHSRWIPTCERVTSVPDPHPVVKLFEYVLRSTYFVYGGLFCE